MSTNFNIPAYCFEEPSAGIEPTCQCKLIWPLATPHLWLTVHPTRLLKNGPSGGIRTPDPLVPNQVRYADCATLGKNKIGVSFKGPGSAS